MDRQNMSEQKVKIFLSYAHVDLGYARKIYDDLKRYGLEIWFDKESLLPGQDWEKEIRKAIRESDYFIALLSDKCLSKRGFVHYELKLCFEIVEKYFPSDTGIFIIPVRLDDCKPSDAYERLGRLHWIDVFPESEYKNGFNKILNVINPVKKFLRSKPSKLDKNDVENLIEKYDFFDINLNPAGKGLNHRYNFQRINNDSIIFDAVTGLSWQQSGSDEKMGFENINKYIDDLNEKRFAGFNDWRLPTIEEAISLVEPEEKNDGYIDPIFNSVQNWIWTADQVKDESLAAWSIDFFYGECSWNFAYKDSYVRAVRSGQSS